MFKYIINGLILLVLFSCASSDKDSKVYIEKGEQMFCKQAGTASVLWKQLVYIEYNGNNHFIRKQLEANKTPSIIALNSQNCVARTLSSKIKYRNDKLQIGNFNCQFGSESLILKDSIVIYDDKHVYVVREKNNNKYVRIIPKSRCGVF